MQRPAFVVARFLPAVAVLMIVIAGLVVASAGLVCGLFNSTLDAREDPAFWVFVLGVGLTLGGLLQWWML